jgi:Asp-tRNA(Asn)/Glu-tRNA(Gln) amidotransferase C subunit
MEENEFARLLKIARLKLSDHEIGPYKGVLGGRETEGLL